MIVGKILLWILGILLALFLFAWVTLWWHRNREGDGPFDERQELMQSKARSFANAVEYIYFLALIALLSVPGNTLPLAPSFLIFAGLLLQLMAYHIYCLLTDAALPMSQNPKQVALTYAVLSGIQALTAWGNVRRWGEGGSWDREMLCLNLVAMVCFLVLAVCYAIAGFRAARE